MLFKKKLNVWILQTGEPLILDKKDARFMRGMNLANKLTEQGHKVLFFSSDFYHQKKKHRYNKNKLVKYNSKLSFQLINSPGYSKNISFKRFYDHLTMAYNLKKIIKKTKLLPDVAFIGYPPIEVSYVMTNWLHKKKIPYLVDIKDQWPHLIVDVFPKFLRPIIKLLLAPYFFYARQIIKNAASVTSMSQSYINWGLKFAKKSDNRNNCILPLTSKKKINTKIKKVKKKSNLAFLKKKNYFNILFLGSISRAFNFDTVINCAKNLNNEKIRFLICGEGEIKNEIVEQAKNIKNIFFLGWIDKNMIDVVADKCHIAIAPYKNIKNFKDNIPNKILDYLSYSLPILSPLTGEVKKILNKNKVGFVYNDESSLSLIKRINKYYNSDKILRAHSNNAKNLFDKKYRYDLVYGKAVELIESIYSKNLLNKFKIIKK
jgi:glycosyltransferase involved in cell wall biosynthesis